MLYFFDIDALIKVFFDTNKIVNAIKNCHFQLSEESFAGSVVLAVFPQMRNAWKTVG